MTHRLSVKAFLFIVLVAFCTLELYAFSPKMQFGFVKNMGQIKDQYGVENKDVLYLYRANNMQVQLRRKGFSYEVLQEEGSNKAPKFLMSKTAKAKKQTQRIDIDFFDANANMHVIDLEEAEGKIITRNMSSLGSDREIKHYKRILYSNVFKGIDIEFLIHESDGKHESGFKYNFIVHKGANLADIKLLVNGASRTQIKSTGALEISTASFTLEDRIPLSYELDQTGKEGKKVMARFVKMGKDLIGLTAQAYDLERTLVIDPVSWCTYYGGSNNEFTSALKTDNSGDVYIGGRTNSMNGIATAGAYEFSHATAADYDAFLAKFSPAGALVWATYYGGESDEVLHEIEVDKFNNVIIGGLTNSSTNIATVGALQTVAGGASDGFVAKFSSAGAMIWSTFLGYSNNDYVVAIASDKDGDLYIAGVSQSVVTLPPGAYKDTNSGSSDVLLIKLKANGNYAYSTFYGGSAVEYLSEICVDLNKNCYIAGYSASTWGIATPGAYQTSSAGTYDGFIAMYDSIGSRKRATYYGGGSSDLLTHIKLDLHGNLMVGGYTTSASGIATTGAFQSTYGGGNNDGFLAKFDTTLQRIWATYVGGEKEDVFQSMDITPDSNVVFYGQTNSTTGLNTVGGFQSNNNGTYDTYIFKTDYNGNRLWSSYFGSFSQEYSREVDVDLSGNFYFLGDTYSNSGLATSGAYHTTMGGTEDAFLMKYVEPSAGPIANNTIIFDQGLCMGEAAALLTGTAPTGGTGAYTYLWTASTTGAAGAYIPAAGVNNTNSYSPGVLSANTWYKRTVFSGTEVHTSNVVSIAVSDKLNAGFTLNKSIQCDRGNNFVFTDTTQAGNPNITRTWDFGNGMYSGNVTDSMSYTFGTENTFVVTLINSLNGACADTASVRIYLIPNPPPANIVGNANVLRGKTEMYSVTLRTGSTYTWIYDKGTGTSNTASINIKWTDLGTTELKLLEQTGGGCYGDTAYLNITIDKPLGGSELAWDSDLLLYPNPSHGMVFIQDGLNRDLVVSVQSILGEQVYQGKTQLDGSIDLSHLSNGIYLIKLSTPDGENFVRRIEIVD